MLVDDGFAFGAADIGSNQFAFDRRRRQPFIPKRDWQLGQPGEISCERARRLRARPLGAVHIDRKPEHEGDGTPLLRELNQARRIEREASARNGFDRSRDPAIRIADSDTDGFGAEIETDQRAANRQERGGVDEGQDRHRVRLARCGRHGQLWLSGVGTRLYGASGQKTMQLRSLLPAIFLTVVMSSVPQFAKAAEIKVISGGAFRQVLNALAAQYQAESGNAVSLTYQTVGQHMQAIKGGQEKFDVAVLTPEAIAALEKDGKIVAGSGVNLAKTGVGVVVKAGTPVPDISTTDAFKKALLAAKSVAYIDPKAGGSSGIYVGKLLERLGIADAVNAKAVLIHGGAVAAHVVDGEAEIGVHQISEILPVKGAVLVGPPPAELQNFTVYSAGVATASRDGETAKAFVNYLSGPHALPMIKAKGMEPVP